MRGRNLSFIFTIIYVTLGVTAVVVYVFDHSCLITLVTVSITVVIPTVRSCSFKCAFCVVTCAIAFIIVNVFDFSDVIATVSVAANVTSVGV